MIAPYQSDESGNMIGTFFQGQARTRRETNVPNARYYSVNAFGRSMLLNVTQTKPLISSSALIQTVHNDGTSTYNDIPHGLHYTGHLVSEPESLVAVSENKGLVS